MQKEILIFQSPDFGQIRTAKDETGEPLFCLNDVCRALELEGKQVNRRLSDEVVSKHPITDSLGRTQLASFVNEDGLYDIILDSRKTEARRFRKWVTSVVLPQIRKTGGYIPTHNIQTGEELSDLEIMALAVKIHSIGQPLIPGALYKATPDWERINDRIKKCKARNEPITLTISKEYAIENEPISHWLS